ncbi:hypothetical protein FACS1894191_6180 [Clostridia bacterium]|nr:hypothetical protein FACS1894191_6180 [Clostridia bacterium]
MPNISMFYGIVIYMYFDDHRPPHIHARYGDDEAAFDFNGDLLEGKMSRKQQNLIRAWIDIHLDELKANWSIAIENGNIHKIEPLR